MSRRLFRPCLVRPRDARDTRPLLLVAGLTVLAAAVRLPTLTRQSLWLDEAQTAFEVRRSFVGMLSVVANNELTPPLYYVLMWPWTRIAGSGELALRLPSALFGIASVPAAYVAGCAVRSRRVGVLAAAFVASGAFTVWFSQEARAYALFVLLAIASIPLFVRALERPDRAHVVRWAAVAALALLTHYFAAFLVGVEALWLLGAGRGRRLVLAATGFLLAIEVALIPLAIHQANAFPPPAVSGFQLRSHVQDLVLGFATVGYPARHVWAAVGALALLAAAFVAFGERADRRAALLALSLAAGTLVLPIGAELAGAGLYNYRHAMGAWFPLVLALAVGLGVRRFAPVGAVVAIFVCLASLALVARTARRPALQRDDWRGAFEVLGPATEPRAIVTSWVYERFPVLYYDRSAEPLSGSTSVRELDLVSVGKAPTPRIPSGFRPVGLRRVQRMTIVRYRASRPVPVSRAKLRRPGSRKRAIGLFLERP